MSRPWTPGPWYVRDDDHKDGYHVGPLHKGESLVELGWIYHKEHAELFALAPEMAEALLLWARAAESDDAYTSDDYVCEMNTSGAMEALSNAVESEGTANMMFDLFERAVSLLIELRSEPRIRTVHRHTPSSVEEERNVL